VAQRVAAPWPPWHRKGTEFAIPCLDSQLFLPSSKITNSITSLYTVKCLGCFCISWSAWIVFLGLMFLQDVNSMVIVILTDKPGSSYCSRMQRAPDNDQVLNLLCCVSVSADMYIVFFDMIWNIASGHLDSPYSVHKAHVGEGEKFLREAFSEAYSQASRGKPAVIFIDELDAICPRRNSRQVLHVSFICVRKLIVK
jgi:hypothetical protein